MARLARVLTLVALLALPAPAVRAADQVPRFVLFETFMNPG